MKARNPKLVATAGAIRRILLGTWLGAVSFFSFVVAPVVFGTIRGAPPDRKTPAPNALAGDIVVNLLEKLAWMGLVFGVLTLCLLILDEEKRHLKWRAGAMLLALASVLGSMVWLTPTMLDLLAQMQGPVDALPRDNPIRVKFDGLHGFSSALHLGMIIGPLIALILEPSGRVTPRGSSAPPGSR